MVLIAYFNLIFLFERREELKHEIAIPSDDATYRDIIFLFLNDHSNAYFRETNCMIK